MESEFNKANKIVTNRRLTIKIKNVNLFFFNYFKKFFFLKKNKKKMNIKNIKRVKNIDNWD